MLKILRYTNPNPTDPTVSVDSVKLVDIDTIVGDDGPSTTNAVITLKDGVKHDTVEDTIKLIDDYKTLCAVNGIVNSSNIL